MLYWIQVMQIQLTTCCYISIPITAVHIYFNWELLLLPLSTYFHCLNYRSVWIPKQLLDVLVLISLIVFFLFIWQLSLLVDPVLLVHWCCLIPSIHWKQFDALLFVFLLFLVLFSFCVATVGTSISPCLCLIFVCLFSPLFCSTVPKFTVCIELFEGVLLI